MRPRVEIRLYKRGDRRRGHEPGEWRSKPSAAPPSGTPGSPSATSRIGLTLHDNRTRGSRRKPMATATSVRQRPGRQRARSARPPGRVNEFGELAATPRRKHIHALRAHARAYARKGDGGPAAGAGHWLTIAPSVTVRLTLRYIACPRVCGPKAAWGERFGVCRAPSRITPPPPDRLPLPANRQRLLPVHQRRTDVRSRPITPAGPAGQRTALADTESPRRDRGPGGCLSAP